MVFYRRSQTVNAPYFLTLTLRDRRSSLLLDHLSELRHSFREAKGRHSFETIAVVVLPEHLHWLCALPDGDCDFSTRVRLIKRGFTRRLLAKGLPLQRNARGEYRLWQPRFWEHTVRDDDDLQRHVDYIHYNPVKHGLVGAVKDWPHSSFQRHVQKGLIDADWGGSVSDTSTVSYGER